MKPQTKSAIHDLSLKARGLLEKEANEQLEGIYGLLPDGEWGLASKYPAIEKLPEAQETRKRLEQFIDDEKAAGLDPKGARDKIIKETAFTWLNRLVAFKMMESRKLMRQTVSKGPQSNGFLMWLTEPGNEKDYQKHEQGDLPQNDIGEGPRQEAYRHFLLWQCAQLAKEIRVLFDPDNLPSRIFPRPRLLKDLLTLLNDESIANAWQEDETIGWVYQYFIEEDKDLVFDKIYTQKQKMSLRDIPPATQIFTPKWIVRYLVENTLGRLWLRMHPDSALRGKMKYFVPNENDRQTIPIKPVRQITLLDPACGTMHFGMVAFDIFYDMYLEELERDGEDGWPKTPSTREKSDIPASIIENNLYGIDLDLRSIQLSALSLFIKAKTKNGSVVLKRLNLTYTDIPEFPEKTINAFVESLDTAHAVTKKLLRQVLPVLNKAFYLGSLLKIETVIQEFIEKERIALKNFRRYQIPLFESDRPKQLELGLSAGRKIVWDEVKNEILSAFQQFVSAHKEAKGAFVANETMKGLNLIDALIRKHDVVVCNPPYSGRRNMNEALRNDLKSLYPKKDGDLYTAFIDRCLDLTSGHYGFCGMVTIHSFMFTSSHEGIRQEIVSNTEIETMAHLGTRTEFDVANKTAQGFSMYTLGKIPGVDKNKASGIYFRLVKKNEEEKHTAFRIALQDYLTNRNSFSDSHVFILEQEKLKAIPGWPVVYWISDELRVLFEEKLFSDLSDTVQGLITSDTFRFLRYWWEVGEKNIPNLTSRNVEKKWYPYVKGGEVNRWYGNLDYVVNWKNDGYEIRNFFKGKKLASRPQNTNFYFREGATYSLLTVSDLSVRYLPRGFIFDVAGPSIFPKNENVHTNLLLGILNSKLCVFFAKLLCPTVNYSVGDIARIPFPGELRSQKTVKSIEEMVHKCIDLKKKEVEIQETSWEFLYPLAWRAGFNNLLKIEKKLALLETEISEAVYFLYELEQGDIDQIEAEFGALPGKLPRIEDLNDLRLKVIEDLYLEKHVPDEAARKSEQIVEEDPRGESETDEESPRGRGRQRRFLTFEELCLASGFHPETVYAYITANNLERSEERYEQAVAWVSYAIGIILGRFTPGEKGALGSGIDENGKILLNADFDKVHRLVDDDGIMVLDPGHRCDLPARVEEALDVLLGEKACKEIIRIFEGNLCVFLERDFFVKWHTPRYRKRPVYWLLQSPRKKYGIWIFHEKLSKDSLFRIQTEYVEPKINLHESQIKELQVKRDGAEGRERRALEKEIGRLVDILDDVREFLKRLNFIIEERGYVPHTDDGVLLNMAPLWELIPSWQREPKKAWEALERGAYDWAYQAMDHWPERVKEKCKTNKSYVIAHGLV